MSDFESFIKANHFETIGGAARSMLHVAVFIPRQTFFACRLLMHTTGQLIEHIGLFLMDTRVKDVISVLLTIRVLYSVLEFLFDDSRPPIPPPRQYPNNLQNVVPRL